MKGRLTLTLFLVAMALGRFAAAEMALHRRISVNYENRALADVLKDIEVKAGVRIAFSEDTVRDIAPIHYEAEEKEAGRILSRILLSRGLKLKSPEGSLPAVVRQDAYREDLQVKRESVYEFVGKPTVTTVGRDTFRIEFETKGWCDCTVVVEKEGGRILRHLASGVLGLNAPEPFRWNSKKQSLLWDGKDDSGRYVDDREDLVVRVSLGLKPRLERNLFWHPKKRMALRANPRLAVQPEGVYVYDGAGVENIRLYGHDGKYIRTVYPFSAQDAPRVKGLKWNIFPDGHKSPQPFGTRSQQAYLYSGLDSGRGAEGSHAVALASHQGSIAVLGGPFFDGASPFQFENSLCRLGTRSDQETPFLYGPKLGLPLPGKSAAFSPDGKWLYITGLYQEVDRRSRLKVTGGSGQLSAGQSSNNHGAQWKNAVYRMEYSGDKPAELWLGAVDEPGKDHNHFDFPTSVCVDASGRVYVADHYNDRVQVFSAEKEWLTSVPVQGPAVVQIHHKTQQLYVFSWNMRFAWPRMKHVPPKRQVAPRLRVFAPFESVTPVREWDLPLSGAERGTLQQVKSDAQRYRAVLDGYTDPVTLWMCAYHPEWDESGMSPKLQVSRFRVEDKEIVRLEDWNDIVQRAISEWHPRVTTRRRMGVDPRTGMLYVESTGGSKNAGAMAKTFDYLLRIDPDTGETGLVHLPFSADDFAIDDSGYLYLRACKLIGRYNLDTMREVPFDYGEERSGRAYSSGDRTAKMIAGIVLPGTRGTGWWEGGMGVNTHGQIVVVGGNDGKRGKYTAFQPPVYPGRKVAFSVMVFDKHGRVVQEDAVQGVPEGYGVFIDNRGDIYYFAGGARLYEGDKTAMKGTGCVMKFKPGSGKLYASQGGRVPLSKDIPVKGLPRIDHRPNRVYAVDGAEWVFPGGGFAPVKSANVFPCLCWNSRFAIDHFGRSFVPQHLRDQVAVLDTNGNLIVQVGRYGNVDDGLPLHLSPYRDKRYPPRSMGGDEVALAYANYVGTHSDRRLFIYDGMNDCIRGVKLGYHTEARVEVLRKAES